MSLGGIRSLNSFRPKEGCAAETVMQGEGILRQSDFGAAIRYLYGRAHRADASEVPAQNVLESIEGNFDLLPGMGRLAWNCATCEARGGDNCSVVEPQEI